MIPDKYCLNGCQKLSERRLSASKYYYLETIKKNRKIRRSLAKTKEDESDKEGECYEAGTL